MTKTTHTNRATCQVCGRIQAVDNGSQIVAKHGYVVAGYGFFNGVCPGAHYLPAEKSLKVTHEIIEMLTKDAARHDARAKAYGAFKRVGSKLVFGANAARLTTYEVYDASLTVVKKDCYGNTYNSRGGYRTVAITADTSSLIVEDEQNKARVGAEQQANAARAHVSMMKKFIVPRLGKEMYAGAETVKSDRKAAKAAKVEGLRFPTKVSRKNALEELSRTYRGLIDELQNFFLAIPHAQRTAAQSEVYYAPLDLCNWRPKHAEAALREFPQAVSIVTSINNLATMREDIKAAK